MREWIEDNGSAIVFSILVILSGYALIQPSSREAFYFLFIVWLVMGILWIWSILGIRRSMPKGIAAIIASIIMFISSQILTETKLKEDFNVSKKTSEVSTPQNQ